MKVMVDQRLCVLTGHCVHAAERVFRLEGGDLAYDASPADAERVGVLEAEMLCPVGAMKAEG